MGIVIYLCTPLRKRLRGSEEGGKKLLIICGLNWFLKAVRAKRFLKKDLFVSVKFSTFAPRFVVRGIS